MIFFRFYQYPQSINYSPQVFLLSDNQKARPLNVMNLSNGVKPSPPLPEAIPQRDRYKVLPKGQPKSLKITLKICVCVYFFPIFYFFCRRLCHSNFFFYFVSFSPPTPIVIHPCNRSRAFHYFYNQNIGR